MQPSQFMIRTGILSLLLGGVTLCLVGANGFQEASLVGIIKPSNTYLTVAFLDVGQGDAIFIETPDGVQMLIDGGRDQAILREIPKQLSLLDRELDVVLATHSDLDHIGGLVNFLERYQTRNIIYTENRNDTAVAEAFITAVEHENAKTHFARAGQELQLGASTTILILSPAANPENLESNSASIVAQLRYGETEFLLTGDASVNIEEYLVGKYGNLLESEVLKLGHHGSRTSTGELFLDTVLPDYAIVSAGKDNSYGHPHLEVITKLENRQIEILETAQVGTIVFKSDGQKVWQEE